MVRTTFLFAKEASTFNGFHNTFNGLHTKVFIIHSLRTFNDLESYLEVKSNL
jgi:hypothetical protein